MYELTNDQPDDRTIDQPDDRTIDQPDDRTNDRTNDHPSKLSAETMINRISAEYKICFEKYNIKEVQPCVRQVPKRNTRKKPNILTSIGFNCALPDIAVYKQKIQVFLKYNIDHSRKSDVHKLPPIYIIRTITDGSIEISDHPIYKLDDSIIKVAVRFINTSSQMRKSYFTLRFILYDLANKIEMCSTDERIIRIISHSSQFADYI